MNKGAFNYVFLFVFINLMLFITCRKSETNDLPQVRIFQPTSNSVYAAFDTITVIAQITDDKLISHVVVSLKDEKNIPVLSQTIDVHATSYDLNHGLIINSSALRGRYYIDVTAYDDSDFGSAYRYIKIESSSIRLNKVFVISEGKSSIKINELIGNKLNVLTTVYGDFLESRIDVKGKRLYTIGLYSGDLTAMDTSGSILWTHDAVQALQVPYFTDFILSDKAIAGLEEGRIVGFGSAGNIEFEKVMDARYKPGIISRHEDQLIYEQIKDFSSEVKLVNLYYPSGAIKGDVLYDYGKNL